MIAASAGVLCLLATSFLASSCASCVSPRRIGGVALKPQIDAAFVCPAVEPRRRRCGCDASSISRVTLSSPTAMSLSQRCRQFERGMGADDDASEGDVAADDDIGDASSLEVLQSLQKSFDASATTDASVTTDDVALPSPNLEYDALDVVKTCMDYLSHNDDPTPKAGLEVCFNFSSERCRAAMGGTLERFLQFSGNPTFGFMVNAPEWKIVSVGPVIPKTPTRGDMQTVLIDVESGTESESRKFLWTLQRERRPPLAGCWLVHECLFLKNAFQQTL